jgi:chromosomal replication initiation ATPase DnaA
LHTRALENALGRRQLQRVENRLVYSMKSAHTAFDHSRVFQYISAIALNGFLHGTQEELFTTKGKLSMLWNTIKTSLHRALPESEFDLWIKPLECRQQDGQILKLVGPDRFFCAWVEDRYLDLIRHTAEQVSKTANVQLTIAENQPMHFESDRRGQLQLPGTTGGTRLRSLHPAFTFEQFMVGDSNLLARSACKALATGDATFGNCLFMNSSTGLGKSHLTQAVVHQVLRSAPSTRLHYLTAQQFSAEMVKGIRTNTMEQFSKKYVNQCDMLLVEDIHTLTGKKQNPGRTQHRARLSDQVGSAGYSDFGPGPQ